MDEVSSYVRLDLPSLWRQGRHLDCSASSSNPIMEGPGADSEEKREPVSDINTGAVESLKALDPDRPIREADIKNLAPSVRYRSDITVYGKLVAARPSLSKRFGS